MKTITWITPTYFVDVDIQIVPELAKTFKISWIISGNQRPTMLNQLIEHQPANLEIEFYNNKSKWYSPLSYFAYRHFFSYVKTKNTDIIYCDFAPQLFAFYAALKELSKHKTVFATHNVKTPKGARHEALARYYMMKLLKAFRNFHTFSRNQQEYLNSLVTGKNVLYAPLTLKDYGCKIEQKKELKQINFLSFGHIRQYKRIDLLILASQQLYEETKIHFKVTIAGNCPHWKRYQKLIKYQHLFDLKIGFIEDKNIPQIFAEANYLILPYQDLAQSGAITVAFNYNVPVIVSDIPQFKEFVTESENGFFFRSESVNSLKECMREALLMPKDTYQELLVSTREYVKNNYSLQAIADKYISYLNKL